MFTDTGHMQKMIKGVEEVPHPKRGAEKCTKEFRISAKQLIKLSRSWKSNESLYNSGNNVNR